jgi:hypothetical protein
MLKKQKQAQKKPNHFLSMENADFGAPLKETLETLKFYIDRQVQYNKLLLGKKLGETAYYGSLLLFFSFLGTLVLIFLSFGFVWWFSDNNYGKTHIGFLIISLFYVLLGLVVYFTRKRLIGNPIRKLLGEILYEEEEDEGNESFHFSSKEMLNHKIQRSKDKLKKQEEVLKEQFAGLGDAYTFTSISQRMLKNAYQSVMTTSNIARFTYLLVQRLKGGKKKQRKKEPPKIEEKTH